MVKIAIIGAGISGLTVGQLLKEKNEVKIFEKESKPGGLIRCERINGSLFHTCGGHVFNSKKQNVLDWFWKFFDRDEDFIKANRNSVVYMPDDKIVPYPIENHAYILNQDIQMAFISDLIQMARDKKDNIPHNFEEFLRGRFGETLYNLYFKPYNEKVWRRNLNSVPLTWLEGKLPMPTIEEMLYNNFNHIEEKKFVHSSFWYEKKGGSQFIADRFSQNLDIIYNVDINNILYDGKKWNIYGEDFDAVVYCGNIKQLPTLLSGLKLSTYFDKIADLESHGTTSVFCEIDRNPYSWIYQPSSQHKSHRIICTGNFSSTNNADGKMTASVEFTDGISLDEILSDLKKMPLHPKYITHRYNKYTYPIQDVNTREMIKSLKSVLAKSGFYMTGRFADWEYYNMDIAIDAAMNTCKGII